MPRMQALRRYSPVELEAIAKFVTELKAKGWIFECPHAPFAAPTVLVRKKDGTLRCTIDYRHTVNAAFQTEAYPLPLIPEL